MNDVFEPRALRRVLGNFATGVTVMTAAVDGRRVGVTANSFNSVSLQPALILWSIDKRSSSYAVFNDAGHFAVNILAAEQIELSNRFAHPGDDRFAAIEVETGQAGMPLLPGCAARLQCRLVQQIDGGDHWILIGQVLAFDDFGRAPLLYHQGAYCSLLPHPGTGKRTDEPAATAFGGRLQDNLYYLMTQAVRRYQADYQPRQLAAGRRTREARLLMALEMDGGLDGSQLQQLIDLPQREIAEGLDSLAAEGLLVPTAGGHTLSSAGMEQAERLWQIADEQQRRVFAGFSQEQVDTFKTVLQAIIRQF
ncbi:p-hydroxyphenylacetate 3-hydroxylase reductase component [Pseudomonas sp. SH1-B]